jgi:hypothetical protein
MGGLLFYLIQLTLSRWWLRRFCFGPVEWLWRSISYLEWQPLIRGHARATSRGTVGVLLLPTFAVALSLIDLV